MRPPPRPQAVLETVLQCSRSVITGMTRLCARPELLGDVLGLRGPEVQDVAPLSELVLGADCDELVRGRRGG